MMFRMCPVTRSNEWGGIGGGGCYFLFWMNDAATAAAAVVVELTLWLGIEINHRVRMVNDECYVWNKVNLKPKQTMLVYEKKIFVS